MEHPILFERSHRDNFVMGSTYAGTPDVMGPYAAGGRTLNRGRKPSRPNLNTNYSYLRSDGHPPRYESAESRSSLTSNVSTPGMTDTSDSEASVDDDYHYNTSASELWDSFWPEVLDRQQSLHRSQSSTNLISARIRDYFATRRSPTQSEDTEEDTITIPPLEGELKDAKPSHWPWSAKSSPPRPNHNRSPATYSVYPKVSAAADRPAPLSAYTAPAPEPPSPTRRPRLKTSMSIANIKTSKSNISLHLPLPAPSSNAIIAQTKSLPVSPLGHPPRLRPSASAYNIRERSQLSLSQHNTTAPLKPIVSCQPRIPEARPLRPQLERFVSVFELDSDKESDAEDSGFAKRIARGLQNKKAAGEKRASGEKKAASAGVDSIETSPGTRRAGPLGRILGRKSR